MKKIFLINLLWYSLIVAFVCSRNGFAKADSEVMPAADLSDPAVKIECKILVAGLMKRQLESISTCIRSIPFKDRRDRAAKLPCIIKCVAIEENFLTKEGLLEQHFMDMYFKREIPLKFHKRAVPVVKKCFDHSAGKLKPDEEYCTSYKPFSRCILEAFPKFCEEEKKKN